MKNICLINGSPRGINSNSYFLIKKVEEKLESYNRCCIHIAQYNSQSIENFKIVHCADIVIIAFPLYVYCVPGLLMRFLEDYYTYCKKMSLQKKEAKVYVIINCAFPDPSICDEAIRVLKNFCKRTVMEWRFAVLVGAGGVLDTVKGIKVFDSILASIYLALEEIVSEIENNSKIVSNNQYIVLKSTKLLEESNSKAKWLRIAFKEGLTEQDLYRKPYEGV